ncbi:MAG: transposase [Chitinophagales bacterium]
MNNEDPNLHLISVDEKTGIQAIERHQATGPVSKGGHTQREHEYKRHGTTTLIGAVNVSNAKMMNAHLQATRDEEDFGNFIKETVGMLPEMDKIVILSDHLNTHLSETLVRFIAEEGGYTQEDLGIKGQSGILANMQTRKKFLESEHHRVRLIYTPKHCSWLNPIENWFAKLQRHIIKNGNFLSVKELEGKIESYIKFYNDQLAKPINWKFKGFKKDRKLFNFVVKN